MIWHHYYIGKKIFSFYFSLNCIFERSVGEPFPWFLPNLPNNVRPLRYTLTIHPNLTTLDVKGQVTIEFHVEKETNFIVLHSQELNITEKVSHTAFELSNDSIRKTRLLSIFFSFQIVIGNCWAQRICVENTKSFGISATSTIVYWIKRSFAEENKFHFEFTMVFTSDTRTGGILCRSIWWRKRC